MADLSDAKVLILAADLFEDMELYPRYRLREEGVAVTLASAGAAAVTGKKGHGPVEADADLADMAATLQGSRRDRNPARVADERDGLAVLVEATHEVQHVVVATQLVGGEPSGDRECVEVVGGATSVGANRDDMVNAGVDWVDEETVVDGSVISARTPDDLGPSMRALLDALRTR